MQRDRFGGQFDAVLAAANRREPWALERIFQSLSPVVAGYLRLQGCREPDDLTSEVFLGVFRNLASFDGGEGEFRSWVFTIARRRLLDERRRLSRHPDPEPLSTMTDPEAADDVQGSVDEAIATERVQALCKRLVPDQREVLLLRLVGQLSVEEVAAAVGKTQGAVRALQHRGFLAIGRLMKREGMVL
ncbi:MAG TPA: RNA polymerase sigma factor [Acidimicrobiales bacterium]|jgi:RNA polymerase sigma-70 factor (ECF subfamily)